MLTRALPLNLPHCRIQGNLKRTLADHHRPSKELLLQPLPLELAPGVANASGGVKRTLSLQPKGRAQPQEEGSSQEQQKLAPLPTGVCLHGRHCL